ncbi:hypothetical protein BDZ85DRAFT_281956 [Elsinoe ampelina]|uniref:Kinase-like domain-containing protein n=1 Tax=Elsinoe ampelina TaxID=302913 RepID=A0A6A6GB10_9PEZI|nr:hypothetical protein BDZ85DRAFT_281956 [Elsinoe ampelina]
MQSNDQKSSIPSSWISWQYPDGSQVSSRDIVAIGTNSIIVRSPDDHEIVKLPRLVKYINGQALSDLEQVAEDSNRKLLQYELEAYRRLAGLAGIAQFNGIRRGGIALRFYKAGSLETYLTTAVKPALRLRLRWMTEATHILRICHHARVLLFDIALRNFVIAEDSSLRAIDFAQASVLSRHTDPCTANVDGLTAKVDMFHLGCLLYSLSSWSRFETDCDDEETWADSEQLPKTDGLAWGSIIRACWARQLTTVQQILDLSKSARARKRLARRQRS